VLLGEAHGEGFPVAGNGGNGWRQSRSCAELLRQLALGPFEEQPELLALRSRA
jgi:hypothetical protein